MFHLPITAREREEPPMLLPMWHFALARNRPKTKKVAPVSGATFSQSLSVKRENQS
jgi:hypothetical protein